MFWRTGELGYNIAKILRVSNCKFFENCLDSNSCSLVRWNCCLLLFTIYRHGYTLIFVVVVFPVVVYHMQKAGSLCFPAS